MFYYKTDEIFTNGIIHLVRMQNLSKLTFLTPYRHTYDTQRVRNVSFSENVVYVLNE